MRKAAIDTFLLIPLLCCIVVVELSPCYHLTTEAFLITSPSNHNCWHCIGDEDSDLVKENTESRSLRSSVLFASDYSYSHDSISENDVIDGLIDNKEFERLDAIDTTIRALKVQLPQLLTKPLTTNNAEKVYSESDFKVSVEVDRSEEQYDNDTNGNGDEFVILHNREELVALSDVLVLATAAAQQAYAAISGGTADTSVEIQCQFILDDAYRIIRIPWKAKAPLLGSTNIINEFEGITDCYLGTDLKVERFVIRQVFWNGQALNGPAIGRALKSIQSTVSNLQKSPIFQTMIGSQNRERTTNFISAIIDGFLDQAATTVASRVPVNGEAKENTINSSIAVFKVKSAQAQGWIDQPYANITNTTSNKANATSFIPVPGTDEWVLHADSRYRMMRFRDEIIPQLSELSIVDPYLFAENATYKAEDESILLKGRERLANFYQSMALTRRGTGGSLSLNKCRVLDWTKNEISVEYHISLNGLPQWKIRARDIYTLDLSTSREERPVIRQIRQRKMTAVNPNGNKISLDSPWLIKNLANAMDGDESVKASRDFLTELMMQQPGLRAQLKSPDKSPPLTMTSRGKLSQSSAACCYNIMMDMHDHTLSMFDISSARVTPPAAEYMEDNVELRGYLGESIVKGKKMYTSSISSIIFGIRDSIRQKLILLEKPSVSRVELLASGCIRLSQTFFYKIPPPGAGVILPESVSGVPVKIELVSDYTIVADTGLIKEHRLVETRINGQLTPGDQVSRWIQQFSNRGDLTSDKRDGEVALKALSDALSWIRSINTSANK